MSSASRARCVEERLQSALVLCAALDQCARFATEEALGDLPCLSPLELLRVILILAERIRRHIDTVQKSLSADCLKRTAIEQGGAQ
jgi:hypothetical protein